MPNHDIVDLLEQTARLLELHDADPFRIRAFQTAAFNLDKSTADLASLSVDELTKLTGVGKTVATKIREIADTGQLQELTDLLAKTPEGVLEMFRISGLGVKKIKVLWRERGLETLRDLQMAAENGQVAQIKGFGEKMQAHILHALEFLQSQSGKIRMDKAQRLADRLLEELRKHWERVEITGQVFYKAQEVDTVQLLIETADPLAMHQQVAKIPLLTPDEAASSPFAWRGRLEGFDVDIELRSYPRETFQNQQFIRSFTPALLATVGATGQTLLQAALATTNPNEQVVFEQAGLPYLVPDMRDNERAFAWAERHTADELVTWDDLRGTLHNHSTWSDGKHTLRQMADYCHELGLSYFGIADHSQTASYAQGLKPDQVRQQLVEIDQLNAEYAPQGFQILKGIESDILADGSLDYDADTLALFDYVVASVHQTLNMSIDKATNRLLRAIENPFTTILGHPTGRLLLARPGYPIDYPTIIDACAQQGVVIEINASPYRLDLDWHWIEYAMDKGVKLSINPDAHSMAGLHDMHYGVAVGRKGGLTKAMTFNALSLPDMRAYLNHRRTRWG